jgi:hypothetical protein
MTQEQIKKFAYKLRKCTANPYNTLKRLFKETTKFGYHYKTSEKTEFLLNMLEHHYEEKYKELSMHRLFRNKDIFRFFTKILFLLKSKNRETTAIIKKLNDNDDIINDIYNEINNEDNSDESVI